MKLDILAGPRFNKFMRWIIIVSLMLTGCAHKNSVLDPNQILTQNKLNLIDRQLHDLCGADCWLDECWYEDSHSYCGVYFSFTPKSKQGEVLYQASKGLEKKGVEVYFTPEDSVGTQLFGAFFFGLGVVLAGAVFAR